MTTAQQHYSSHLAPIYLWMVGGAEAALAMGMAEAQALQLPANKGDSILDLGAGFGMHSIPLALSGAHVTAVDTSAELLDSLRDLAGDLPVQTVNADLVDFVRQCRRQFAAVLCMGDTLAHLSSGEDARELCLLVRRILSPGGALVLTFRDYTHALRDEQRFIPVRADDSRILTCFLENKDSAVMVHDIVHEKEPAGWKTNVSAYRKLRLVPNEIIEHMRTAGFDVRREAGLRGMVRLVGVRSQSIEGKGSESEFENL